MKSGIKMWSIAATLFAALAMPVGMAAQDNPSQEHKPQHKKYRLIDLATFGGNESAIDDITRAVNAHGVVIGVSETTVPQTPTNNFFACQSAVNTSTNVLHAFASLNGSTADLGALAPAANNCSTPVSISDNGNIAGVSENGIVDPSLGVNELRAVLWSRGQLLNLGTLGGTASFGQSVNNAGQVTGLALNSVPDPYSIYSYFFFGSSISTQGRAFLWQNGTMRDLGSIGGGNAWGIVVNNAGEVAGNAYTNDTPNGATGVPTIDPFFWKNGTMTDAGSLGGVFGLTNDMNNRGQVVGFSDLAGDQIFHAFLWDRGRLTDLGTFGGSTSEARWINESGEAVGAADFAGDQFHDAVIWKNGRKIDLGNLGITSFAHANNNAGQVVGASRFAPGPLSSSTAHAFLWENGGPMVDLNDLIPPNSSLVLEYADTIGDQGIIAGTGTPAGCNDVDDGCGHAFVLLPDGNCDSSCQSRIAKTAARITLARASANRISAPIRRPLSPAERVSSMMRQRYHLPGQAAAPRD